MPDARPHLAHRDSELAAIDTAWAELADGRPAVVLVEGPRGIGRTTLLQAAVDRLPRSVVVLRARCTVRESGFPMSVVDQLFDPVAAGRSALDGGGPGADAEADDDQQVLRALYATTRSLAEAHPLVLAIDDLHLADVASLRWFSYITRRLQGLPVGMIATVGPRDDGLLDELDPPDGTVVLRPSPLCETCSADVVADHLHGPLDPELATACHVLSMGNPTVLHDLVRRLEEAGVQPGSPDVGVVLRAGADSLAATTLAWLEQQDPAAGRLLAALAVLGPRSDPSVAALLADQGEVVAEHAVRTLAAAGLVEPGPPVRFTQDLLRSAVLSRIAPADRLPMHRRTADLLTRVGAPPTAAAEHLMLAGCCGEDWAMPVLLAAADDHTRDGDWAAAARLLRRAAVESTDGAMSLELAGRLAALDRHHDLSACERYVAATAAAVPPGPDRAARLLPVVSVAMVADAAAPARTLVETVGALVPRAGTPGALRLVSLALSAGHRGGVRAWTRAALQGPAPAVALAELRSALAGLTASTGAHRERCVRLAERARPDLEDTAAVVPAALTLSWAGRPATAATWATWLVEAARTAHHTVDEALALVVRADAEVRRGRLAVALTDAQDALRLAAHAEAPGLHAAAGALVVRCLVERGQLDLADDVLGRIGSAADGHPLVRGTVLHARSVLSLARGEADEALRAALECGHQLAARGITNPAAVPWREAVVSAYLALGEPAAAVTIATEELESARRWGAAAAVGAALTLVARASRAVAPARQAVVVLSGVDAPLAEARAWAALSTLLSGSDPAAGETTEADAAGHRAADLAGRCGATALAATVDVDATGGTPVRGPSRLTASESRVTTLVLQGMSNQEVADSLCISRRTVDTHLNRIYRKLDIRSRTDLADALEQIA